MVGFARGRTILYRNISAGELVSARPTRVVADDDRGLLLYLPKASAMGTQVAADGRGVRAMPFAEWVTLEHHLVESVWQGPAILKFLPPDVDHSVWFLRDDADRFAAWYVNLEEHGVRWDDGAVAGVDVVDQDLDIVVASDRTWRWKDEDEFAERLAHPDHYWVSDEAAVWAEGRRVLKTVEVADFPFDGTWTDFEPDPAWSKPLPLPKGWDRPSARNR